jgi:hypothetical protein
MPKQSEDDKVMKSILKRLPPGKGVEIFNDCCSSALDIVMLAGDFTAEVEMLPDILEYGLRPACLVKLRSKTSCLKMVGLDETAIDQDPARKRAGRILLVAKPCITAATEKAIEKPVKKAAKKAAGKKSAKKK